MRQDVEYPRRQETALEYKEEMNKDKRVRESQKKNK
jgi:hypothetical protein